MKKFAMLAMALLVGLSLAAAEAEGEAKKEAKPEKAGEKAGEKTQRKRRGLFALMSEEECTAPSSNRPTTSAKNAPTHTNSSASR